MKTKIEIEAKTTEVEFTAKRMEDGKLVGEHNRIVLSIASGKVKANWGIYNELKPADMRDVGRAFVAIADAAEAYLKKV